MAKNNESTELTEVQKRKDFIKNNPEARKINRSAIIDELAIFGSACILTSIINNNTYSGYSLAEDRIEKVFNEQKEIELKLLENGEITQEQYDESCSDSEKEKRKMIRMIQFKGLLQSFGTGISLGLISSKLINVIDTFKNIKIDSMIYEEDMKAKTKTAIENFIKGENKKNES